MFESVSASTHRSLLEYVGEFLTRFEQWWIAVALCSCLLYLIGVSRRRSRLLQVQNLEGLRPDSNGEPTGFQSGFIPVFTCGWIWSVAIIVSPRLVYLGVKSNTLVPELVAVAICLVVSALIWILECDSSLPPFNLNSVATVYGSMFILSGLLRLLALPVASTSSDTSWSSFSTGAALCVVAILLEETLRFYGIFLASQLQRLVSCRQYLVYSVFVGLGVASGTHCFIANVYNSIPGHDAQLPIHFQLVLYILQLCVALHTGFVHCSYIVPGSYKPGPFVGWIMQVVLRTVYTSIVILCTLSRLSNTLHITVILLLLLPIVVFAITLVCRWVKAIREEQHCDLPVYYPTYAVDSGSLPRVLFCPIIL